MLQGVLLRSTSLLLLSPSASFGRGLPCRLLSVDSLPAFFMQIQKVLAGMCDRGAQACVMECPSIALDQHLCHYVYYALAVFTNLVPTHLDYHETLEEYIEAKGLLFKVTDVHPPCNVRHGFVCVFCWLNNSLSSYA